MGTIEGGRYTAPSNAQSMAVTITATSGSNSSSMVSAGVFIVAPGMVAPTQNPQVALYTITPPAAANVTVGLTTSYGLATRTTAVPANGGSVGTFVAGMLANSTYHMQATLQFADGVTFTDSDQVFTTASLPAAMLPVISTTTTPGMTPQSGVELLDVLNTATLPDGPALRSWT